MILLGGFIWEVAEGGLMQRAFDWSRTDDFSDDRPSLGLSGGINSAALLCFLATEHPLRKRPSHILLYHAWLKEHSPETTRFVADCVRYARRRFLRVEFGMHRTSVNEFFERENFIPHPTVSPCTWHLKVEPMERWTQEHGGTIDLVGFVRHEMARRGEKHIESEADLVRFPIAHLTEEQCFELVDREIGWHPPIYDIRDKRGKRVFSHNNCLPCKNMSLKQLKSVAAHYPQYYAEAMAMAQRINNYWGRASEYTGDPCALCVFD